MRCCLLFVYALLLSLPSCAAGGTNTVTRHKVDNPDVVASIKGRLAAVAGKQVVRAVALGALLTAGATDSFARMDGELDYVDVTESLVGGFAPRARASVNAGFALETTVLHASTRLRFESAIRPNVSDGGAFHDGDYLGRVAFRQAMDEAPSIFLDVGAAQYARNRRQINVVAGLGFHIPIGMLGTGSELQLRVFDAGWLGEAWYDEQAGEFTDGFDINSVTFGFSMRLDVEELSVGRLLNAEASSLLHVFAIPKASLTCQGFTHSDNSDDGVSDSFRLESTVHLLRWLGFSVEWNRTGESKTHKRFLAMLSFNMQ